MVSSTSNALVSSIESEIKRRQEGLEEVDENIKRLTGRNFAEPQSRPDRRVRVSHNGREDDPPLKRGYAGRDEEPVRKRSYNGRDEEPPPKRKPPGGVFARLGAPVLEASRNESRSRKIQEMPTEEEPSGRREQKPSISSSVARPPVADGKSRTEAAAELTKDRASRDRNRRMFGALLGTLQRFRNDEAKQKDKEDKRVAIEKKLEEKGKAEQELLRRQKLVLFRQREEQRDRIRRLHFKMMQVKEHEEWEAYQRQLKNFIRTESSPKIFWLPRLHNTQSSRLISATREVIEDELEIERQKLEKEFKDILDGAMDHRHRDEDPVDDDDEEFEDGELTQGRKTRRRSSTPPAKRSPLQVEIRKMDYDNSDLLDYEAEEGELVYEDDAQVLSGKVKKPERVVVQVKRETDDSNVEGGSHRKVELVSIVKTGSSHRRVEAFNPREQMKDKSSMKENVQKRENVGIKEKERSKREKGHAKDKKDKKHKRKEKEGRDKESIKEHKNISPNKDNLERNFVELDESATENIKKEKLKEPHKSSKMASKVEIKISSVKEDTEKKDSEEVWSEDLSHILLPLDPQPVLSEGGNEDSQSSVIPKEPQNESEDVNVKPDTSEKDPTKQLSLTPMLVEKAKDPSQVTPKEVESGAEADGKSYTSPRDSPVKSKTSDHGIVQNEKVKNEDVSGRSSESEDSSSDSESSISDSESSEQSDSVSSSGSSSLSSSSGSEKGSKTKQPVRVKRRRPVRRSSSESSSDASSDSEGDSPMKKKMPYPPSKKRGRTSPLRKESSQKMKDELESDSEDDKPSSKSKFRSKPDNKEKDYNDTKRERDRKEKEREELKRKERERDRLKGRENEKRGRERVKDEKISRRSHSREKRRDRSQNRDKRREKK